MKQLGLVSVWVVSGLLCLNAGDLNPPAAPNASESAMFTLEDIYNRLNEGLTGTKRGNGFVEPSSGPTANSMFTLDQIMAVAPVGDNTSGSLQSQVLADTTFWSLRMGVGDIWGMTTGTMPNIGKEDFTPGIEDQDISTGFHDGTGVVAGDSDLVAENIGLGTTIFGVDGRLVGPTTCTGTLSPLGRWCDNGDGTITDTTSGLIWYYKGNQFWGAYESEPTIQCAPCGISDMRHGHPEDLTDGSDRFDWRLPSVAEMLKLTSGVEAISPSSQYFFSGIATDSYWTCSMNTTPIPMMIMKVNMPETLGYGVAVNPLWLCYAMAVRGPL